MLPHAVAECVM